MRPWIVAPDMTAGGGGRPLGKPGRRRHACRVGLAERLLVLPGRYLATGNRGGGPNGRVPAESGVCAHSGVGAPCAPLSIT